jgi:hypothetical protein
MARCSRGPGRGRTRSGRLAAAVLVAACAFGSAGCIREQRGRTPICTLTAQVRPEMQARHISFTDVVSGNDAEEFAKGVGSVLVFVRSAGVEDVEPAYRPAIDFIIERTLADAPALAGDAATATRPALTDQVVTSARNLDADLDAGACG